MLKFPFLALAALVAAPVFGADFSQKTVGQPPLETVKKAKTFAVRVSFNAQKSNAEGLVKTLEAKGHDNVKIVDATSGNGNQKGFAVVLGKYDRSGLFASRTQAETYLEQLVKKYKKDASLGPLFEQAIVVEI